MSLVSLLEELTAADDEMNKEASEMQKLAAEEDAAGRITARGFMDELQKLGGMFNIPPLKGQGGAGKLPARKPVAPPAINPNPKGRGTPVNPGGLAGSKKGVGSY